MKEFEPTEVEREDLLRLWRRSVRVFATTVGVDSSNVDARLAWALRRFVSEREDVSPAAVLAWLRCNTIRETDCAQWNDTPTAVIPRVRASS